MSGEVKLNWFDAALAIVLCAVHFLCHLGTARLQQVSFLFKTHFAEVRRQLPRVEDILVNAA
jgi:hypothetical protein